MKDKLLELITQFLLHNLIDTKPVIILDIELEKLVREEILSNLRQLYKEKKIDFGRTINNNFITLINEDVKIRTKPLKLHKIYGSK